jgi:poly(A) polymerase
MEEKDMFSASRQFEAALVVIVTLRTAGYEAYLAGGCVRDLLQGRAPSDYDVATSATPDVVLRLFDRTFAVGAHFGVVLVAHDEGDSYFTTEVATFRSDGAYSDGRHPDAVRYTTSAEEDVRRRDFTINGLLLDPSLLFPQGLKPVSLAGLDVRAEARTLQNGGASGFNSDGSPVFNAKGLRRAVIDFVGGVADLEAGVIRAIGHAAERFEEDRLRMLRAVRFAARLGFELEPATAAAMRALAPRIASVSRERVRDELTRMLSEGHARRAFELLDETGLLAQVLPEIARMKGVEQPPQYHPEGDVWIHTLMLLDHLPAGASPTLAWGMLLHDIGKPATFTPPDPSRAGDRIRFNGHVEVGIAIARSILNRLRFSNEDCAQILALIKHHMQFGDVKRMKQSTLKRFLRLPQFDQHLALHYADVTSSHGMLEMYTYAKGNFEQLGADEIKPQLLLTGEDLIRAGYKPGPQFREMLTVAEDAQLEGAIATREQALALVRERFGDPAKTEVRS